MRIGILCCSLVMAASAAGDAVAADWFTGRGSAAAPSDSGSIFATSPVASTPNDDNWIVAVDSSVSGTSQNSLFGNVVGTFAATGHLKQTGARVRVDALAGSYSYKTTTAPIQSIRSTQMAGSGLVGYEWVSRNTTAAIYVGVAAQNVSLSTPDPLNKVQGTSIGAKISGEFYTRPSQNTMASGYASYTTLHNSYYTRLKYGWAILDDTYVGPEVAVLGDALYRQIRAGVHITGFKVAGLQFGISGGYVRDFKTGSGFYGILDARFGF